MKIAVYTSVTAGKDALKEAQNFHGADFIAFTDFAPVTSRWTIRRACDLFRDPRRNARIHKVLAHQYLPDYDYSLWMDGTMRLLVPVQSLIEDYLRDADIAMFAHGARHCVYDEAEVCKELGLDSAELITEQVEQYRAAGYPVAMGLNEAPVILRRHSVRIEQFNNFWWSEICRFSRRDQISVNYVLHALQIKPALFPGTVFENPGLFVQGPHSYVEDRQRTDAMAHLEGSISQLLSRLDEKAQEVAGAHAELDDERARAALERRTVGYRLLTLARAAAAPLVPPGSSRRHVYARVLALLDSLTGTT